MRKLILIFLFFLPLVVFPQYNMDVGGFLGGANYLGEIGGKDKDRRGFVSDIQLSQTRWAVGTFARYSLPRLFSVNLGFTYARIQGADSLSTALGRFGRNLSFRNDFFELALRGEVNLIHLRDVGSRGRYRIDLKVYAFAGGAVIYHNPKAKYQGSWVALQPLQTEGVKYSKIAPTIPMGGGFYFTYDKRHRIGWEFGWRMTFTDYLDDASTVFADPNELNDPLAVALANRRDELPIEDPRAAHKDNYNAGATRGNPNYNDSYLFSQITYSYVLRGKNSFYRSKYHFIIGSKRKKRRTRAKF